MDLTNVTLEELEAKLDEVQQNISIEKQRGPEKNEAQIAAWEREEADTLAQMDAVTSRQINDKHEIRVEQATNDFANFLGTLDNEGGLTLRQLASDEGDYQLLTIKLKRGFALQATQFSDQIKGFEEREAQLKRQNDHLQEKLSASEAGHSETKLSLNDAEAKRDAAARELDEAKAQIQQLKDWNDRLQREKVIGVRGDIKVVNPEEEARLELEARAKRLVYDVEPVEKAGSPKNYNATLVVTGERFTYNWIQMNYYMAVSREEGQQFLQTYETAFGKQAADAAPVTGQITPETPDIPAVAAVTDEQFRKADAVSETSTTAEMAQPEVSGVVTRAEYDQLKKAVDVAYIRLSAIEEHVMSGATSNGAVA